MEVGEVASQASFRTGEFVRLRMEGGITVDAQVAYTVKPARPGDEPVCVVSIPIPLSQIRRA